MDFSIIIPAKNEEKNIGKCLDSINAITFDDECFEVLVVDNGSSDRTVEIARDRGARVFEKPNITISGLRNLGASQANGNVLVFLDADCTVASDWLCEASRYLNSPEISCFGGPPGIPSNATWVQKAWFRVREKNNLVEEVEWLESMNMFIPKDKFDSVGGFNEDLVTCEDYDISVRLKKIGQIVADQRIVAVHHGEATDLGHFFRKEHWRATSNVKRLKSCHFNLRELPSLIVPPIHCLLASLLLVLLLTGHFVNSGFLILLILWQAPLALLAVWKTRGSWDARVSTQLFVLLNVYFFARGLAFFRSR
jgi:glycosyltransferase involved in cell wall biosynthesis